MGSDLEFASEFVGVTGVNTTHVPGPTATEQFANDPTSYVLLGILALLAVGLFVLIKKKAN